MKDRGFIIRCFEFLQGFADPQLVRSVIKPAIFLLGLNLLAAVLVFMSNWLLVRSLGESGYGNYVLFNLWLTLLSVFCLFGMDDLLTVQIPKLTRFGNNPLSYEGLLFWGLKICVIATIVVLLFLFGLRQTGYLQPVISEHFFWLCLLLPAVTIALLLVQFFRAINRTLTGQFAEKAIRPFLFLAGCAVAYFVVGNTDVASILQFQWIAVLVAIVFLVFQARKQVWHTAGNLPFDRSIKANVTFVSISLLNMAGSRLDLLVLERFVLPSQIGHYNIAARIADLAAFPVIGLNLLIPVMVSRVFYQDKPKLRQTLKTFVILTAGATLLALLVVVLAGIPLLSFFGHPFRLVHPVLIVLCIAQLFAALGSPLNALLMVSGKQRYALLSLGVFVSTSLVSCVLLIPAMGLNGAAFGMLAGQLAYAMAVWYFAYTKVLR